MKDLNTEHLASEAEKKALQGFEEHVLKVTKELFLEKGDIPPFVYVGQDIGKGQIAYMAIPVDEFMRSVQSKNDLAELMKKIGDTDPLSISLVTEAWMVKGNKADKDDLMKITPSEHPDRIECIIGTFESENICKTYSFEIKREGGLSLSEDDGQSTENLGGRFGNILKDMKKIKQN